MMKATLTIWFFFHQWSLEKLDKIYSVCLNVSQGINSWFQVLSRELLPKYVTETSKLVIAHPWGKAK